MDSRTAVVTLMCFGGAGTALACAPFASSVTQEDAASQADAGTDASSAGCRDLDASGLLFCDDFDQGGAIDSAWYKSTDPTVRFAVEGAGFSPPNAVRCQIDAVTGANNDAFISRAVAVKSRYTLVGRFLIRKKEPSSRARLFGLSRRGSSTMQDVALDMTGRLVSSDAVAVDVDVPPTGQWVRFRLHLEGSVAELDLDGKLYSTALAPPPAGFDRTTALIGPRDAPAAGTGWDVLFDDVALYGD
jgi:hypothetical protein